MSSPTLSTQSFPSSSRSQSPARSISTAPSTPSDAPLTYYLVTHPASAAFLQSLSVRRGSRDRILHGSGVGHIRPLLLKAKEVLADDAEILYNSWQRVKAVDNGHAVIFWRVQSPSSDVGDGADAHVDSLEVNSSQLGEADALNLYAEAHLRSLITLHSNESAVALRILERPPFSFNLLSHIPTSSINPLANPYNVPSSSCFRELWSAWDLVTLGMIPTSMLHQKPIDLRHKPLFYIGHLPTFNALLLTKLLRIPMVEPRNFSTIFERGIDPHVDDPDHCHNHSEVPEKDEDWPHLGQILAFRDRVRDLVLKTLAELESGRRPLTRRMARTLMMMHEHEGFHIETLLYMLIQRAGTGTLPPPGFAAPSWAHLSTHWNAIPAPSTKTAIFEPCTLTVGHEDCESDDLLAENEHNLAGHNFGWDNESPRRAIQVARFKVEWRPVTNGEFLAFWKKMQGEVPMPPSWAQEEDEIKVRTLYGAVAMEFAKDWPCLTAYDDLLAYARSKGGRIPTEAELRLFLDTYQVSHHEGANVGFRNWHPLPATMGLAENGGRGSNGGVWEWTATLLDTHEGFEGTSIFPGYSSDFFDTKHHVVLGASYATIPRLADRRTVRNFYQHNYPYPWVAARVAYDA